MRNEATKLVRTPRPGLAKLRAEVTRVDELAQWRARAIERRALMREEAEAFEPPDLHEAAAPRALLSL
jgi:hypothetical protein